jgi:hypothetical protein
VPQARHAEASLPTAGRSPGQSPSPPVVDRSVSIRAGSRNNVLLLLGVAAAFLLIGIGLAVILMKAVR